MNVLGYFKRLITSIRRYYPCLHIIVVDDSNSPLMIDEVQTIVLPYNSGVSLGRIEGLKQVMTKYILLLDDDFVFFRHTNLVNSLTIMEQFPKIDIMGGQVINLPYFSTVDYRNALIYPTKAESTFPKESLIGGMPVYDIVANFFIGRTDRVRIVGWTPELKRIDHNDFFSRAKGVLTTVFNKDLKCLHARNPYDSNYMKNRSETTQDLEILQNRYYRNKISG